MVPNWSRSLGTGSRWPAGGTHALWLVPRTCLLWALLEGYGVGSGLVLRQVPGEFTSLSRAQPRQLEGQGGFLVGICSEPSELRVWALCAEPG